MLRVTVFSENRSDEGLLADLRLQLKKDTDIELCEDGDLLFVLGDRSAALKEALKWVVDHKCVAHISGGEQTSGSIDDSIRHAITKLSHIHFVSTEKYQDRVSQLGESNIYWVGEPGLDNIRQTIAHKEKVLLVTYHPTKEKEDITPLLDALSSLKMQTIITEPQHDLGWQHIVKQFEEYAKQNPHTTKYVQSLGRDLYLQHLKSAIAVIGNSSSGIVEAPSFGTRTVNIGDRQKGRIQGNNVANVKMDTQEIIDAVVKSDRVLIHQNPYYKDG